MYSLNEIGLIPTILSNIEHRSGINPYYPSVCKEGIVRDTFGKLPVFVSPMSCILNEKNIQTFLGSKVTPIMPRSEDILRRLIWSMNGGWSALSLQEFENSFCDEKAKDVISDKCHNILIDVANGHMSRIYDDVRKAKAIWKNRLTVMVGNIANPETYLECCKAGVDYVRVGIGGGNACTTGVQTGIHASMVWLLTEIQKIKKEIDYFETEDKEQLIRRNDKSIWESWQCNGFRTKVIADGGIDTIDKAIKCLALGADYVMMGKLFAQTKEACGTVKYEDIDVSQSKVKQYRQYYGMASEQGQKDISGGVKKNPEGLEIWVPIKYTLNEFLDKFEATLRSCMSYCGAHNLSEFIGKVKWEPMTEAEFRSYYK